MPARNVIKQYGEREYYHVYNRGVNKQNIFLEADDYWYFLSLMKRHLSPEISTDKYGRKVPDYSDKIELSAFCLMPNHYHMLVYLHEPDGLALMMRSVMTAYVMYFNKKYKRVGGLFQGVFLASLITSDYYLWHVSRYIHLNPIDIGEDFTSYPYSSIDYYKGDKQAKWLHEERLVETSKERDDYIRFVADYKEMRADLNHLKKILAST